MCTQQEKDDNIERVVREVAAMIVPRGRMHDAIASAELNGVRKAHVVELVEGVLGMLDATGSPPAADHRDDLLAMIDKVYRGKAA